MGAKKPPPLRFADFFAGLGGFHLALKSLGHVCVFASEIDVELAKLYERNLGLRPQGDIRQIDAATVPEHDVLCAGFPCQPFSKAGEQLGTRCQLWGDLFEKHVLRVIRHHYPAYLVMENVANLERHDGGSTWRRMRRQLESAGYSVDAKVLSPHHFGIPQIRERLFIVGSRNGLASFEWPKPTQATPSIHTVLDKYPRDAKALPAQVVECLHTWQDFLDRAPAHVDLSAFPIWTMEFGATYPFTKYDSLQRIELGRLRAGRGCFGRSLQARTRAEIIDRLPSYARADVDAFPMWKQAFIRNNRRFFRENEAWIRPWLPRIRQFPSSLQKLEWHCHGEERNIWNYVIQFRASGVRVKRPSTAPSLVAMTTTQVPIIGWERRYMTPRECARLQSMDDLAVLPAAQTRVCKALGNAVNVNVVRRIANTLCAVAIARPTRRA